MRSHMARFADVQVGDSVYYVEDTLWGCKAGYVRVCRVRLDGELVELELRQKGRLVARVLHSPDIEIRVMDRPNNIFQLRAA